MSIPITIFLPRRSPWSFLRPRWGAADLNAKLAAHGFEVQVDGFNPKTQVGYLPCVYRGESAGFEYFREPIDVYLESVDEMRECEPEDFPYSHEDLQRVQRSGEVIQLVTHSRHRDRAAAVVVASCLADLTSGWLLDEPLWGWHEAGAAVEWARGAVKEIEPHFVEDDE